MAHSHAHHIDNHHHGHTHDHGHNHNIVLTSITKAFVIGIILNFLFIVIEVIIGLSIHSVSLLSDAGHNLADVGSLGLSLLAFRLMKVKSNERYTYGYRKTTVLTALLNAFVLLISIGAILYEAINHFFHPVPLPGKTVAIVAGIGIIINGTSALFFLKEKDKDINIKSAYIHLMADALVSLGLVVGGLIISFTHWYKLDAILSILIATTILISTWKILKDSLRLSMDGVPKGIDLDKIRAEALTIKEISDIYHIHIWAISTSENAMTAHVVLKNTIDKNQESIIKHNLRHLMEHLNIQHLTLETEWENATTNEQCC